MLSCKDVNKLASEHVDKEMPFFLRMKFKLHLKMCQHCRNFVAQFETTINTLNRLNIPTPDESTIERQTNELMEIAKNLKSTKNH